MCQKCVTNDLHPSWSTTPPTPTVPKKEKNSGHACTVDGCVGVRATKEASALKLVAACQVKLTLGVLRPLCRWTIEPRIRMKHPSAVTEPVFVSAAARPLSLAALMSFSDSLGFQMRSGSRLLCSPERGVDKKKKKTFRALGFRRPPQTAAVCLPEHVYAPTHGFRVGHLTVEVSVVGWTAGRSHIGEEVG